MQKQFILLLPLRGGLSSSAVAIITIMDTTLPFASIAQWWASFDTIAQVFMGIGLAAGAVTLVLLALTIFGLDHGGVGDALDAGADAGGGDGSLFSTRSIAGFFLGFGGGGSVVYERTGETLLACAAGVVLGTVSLYAMYWVAKKLMRLQSDGTVDFTQALGSTGTVYITIPAKRGSGGQAQIVFNNRHEVVDAITDSGVALPAGTPIRVKEYLARNLFLVEGF
jgi:hypothetical protein